MYDPSYIPFGQQQAGFGGYSASDPLGYLARIKAAQEAQNPQNQIGAATGTAGTDLAKIMQILKQRKLLESLQGQPSYMEGGV